MENNHYNGRITNNSGYSVMPNQSNAPFCAQDVLYTSTNDLNGLFVVMRQNFLNQIETHVRSASNEAVRYHHAVGLAHKDNVLPRIVSKLEHDTSFSTIVTKIKALLEIFESFNKDVGTSDVVTLSSHEIRINAIVTIVHEIINLGRAVKPVERY